MNVRELRALPDDKLRDTYEDLKEELYTLRINRVTGELKDTSSLRRTRRSIARLLSVLREREAANQAEGK
jgi:large subunit ribosomal protein L29